MASIKCIRGALEGRSTGGRTKSGGDEKKPLPSPVSTPPPCLPAVCVVIDCVQHPPAPGWADHPVRNRIGRGRLAGMHGWFHRRRPFDGKMHHPPTHSPQPNPTFVRCCWEKEGGKSLACVLPPALCPCGCASSIDRPIVDTQHASLLCGGDDRCGAVVWEPSIEACPHASLPPPPVRSFVHHAVPSVNPRLIYPLPYTHTTPTTGAGAGGGRAASGLHIPPPSLSASSEQQGGVYIYRTTSERTAAASKQGCRATTTTTTPTRTGTMRCVRVCGVGVWMAGFSCGARKYGSVCVGGWVDAAALVIHPSTNPFPSPSTPHT